MIYPDFLIAFIVGSAPLWKKPVVLITYSAISSKIPITS